MANCFFNIYRCFRLNCPRFFSSKEERVRFAKYPSFQEEIDLAEVSNGTVWKRDSLKGVSEINSCGDLTRRDAEGLGTKKITEWQAAWNVTNAIQGMFIVSFPFAVLQGGYWAVFAMVLVAYICCHTGKILVDCLYENDENGSKVRVRDSYVDIAEHVWGKRFGGKIVNCAQIIELLMTCILYVLLCGDLMSGSFPYGPIDLSSWIMIMTTFLLPCAFLQSLRSVSWLSFWCTVAHMAINAIIIIYCFTKAAEWKWTAVQVKIDIWTFPISLGIVVFSYTSQIFLPTLEGNLIEKGKFSCMMNWTHIAAAVFKALFSYIGFLTWGEDTQEVITNNLPTESFKIVVNMILVIKALFSYPLPYFAVVELIETALFQGSSKTLFPSCSDDNLSLKVWALALRIGLVLLTTLLAIFIPHFAILMGLIGSFTGTMLSFVWPCCFHLKIKWSKLKWYQKGLDIGIILLGVVFGSIGIYYSVHALSRAFRGLPTNPEKSPIPIVPKINSGKN
ncbi:hypothetical protein ACJMK2_041350 [Sinanodonta woodiana]|uniref:Vesicular inhibitory amino acid transporter n=1 Tax=Sinanodonta woodiana TaxID=1069815 RepID=A0ABD3W3U1_SINWO